MCKRFFILLLAPIFCFAQPKRDSLINDYMQGEYLQGFNGNVLIAQNGKIIYQQALGYRNFPLKQPLINSSVFELASVSKQFTAAGILMLKARGKLRLTDTLGMYFPQLPYPHITVYQLLTHTSGLPDYLNEMDKLWDHHKIAFNHDVIQFLATHHPALYFIPGSRYDYSNTGYVLLASIIEKLTGETYNDYLKQNIFKPLGMDSSKVYNWRRSKRDTIVNYAYGYVLNNNTGNYILPDSLKQDDFVYWLDGVTGDATVNSTTHDLLKWENAILHHSLLSKEDQTDMISPHTLTDTLNQRYYGFGVELGTDQLGRFITHNGLWPGYSTVLSHYYKGGYTIIVLSNNQFNAVGVSQGLAYLLNGKPVVMPYLHKQTALNLSVLKRYVGKYAFPAKIELVERNGKLYRHLPGRGEASDVELKPESPTKFFYANKMDIQLEFEFDANNQIANVFVINCGIKTRGSKTN
jgi:CubicO group peptidase (beta-lactamase class C family)